MKWEQGWLEYRQNEFYKDTSYFKEVYINQESDILLSAIAELKLAFLKMFNITLKVTLIQDLVEFELDKHTKGIYLYNSGKTKDEAIDRESVNDPRKLESYSISFDQNLIQVNAISDAGILYGVFDLIKQLVFEIPINKIYKNETPQNPLRMLNHWDNLDGSIERGYSGESFFFSKGEIINNDRIKDYARLVSSVGINGVVINNVNVAGDAIDLITSRYFDKLAFISRIFSLYNIKLFLSVDYAAPIDIGELETADPLDEQVVNWWQHQTKEVFDHIPNFGGFLVKADSEGRPGPFTYHRSHSEGANLLARAVKPYNGIIIWRCFVYNCKQDWRDNKTDRAKAQYDHFQQLDKEFDDNVILQIKNGPMDFQVREPVSPLLGSMKHTNQIMEVQIAQEYTGQQRHVCYLVPMWKEVLDFKTYCVHEKDRIADIVSGETYHHTLCGMAAVANTGNDMNWTRHDLANANLYGYGRLAWNSQLSSETIAKEWIQLSYNNKDLVVDAILSILLNSWPAYEKYTSFLGIGWMVNPNHHYGPNVDGYEYDRWGTYHKADHKEIGINRGKYGTDYTSQYFKENEEMYSSIETCPEELLLFFHRIPYDYQLKTNKTLIQHIYDSHFEGVEHVKDMILSWKTIKDYIEPHKYTRTLLNLQYQEGHAKEWRDVINTYFYRKSGIQDEKQRRIYS